jgi:hypothetical protein
LENIKVSASILFSIFDAFFFFPFDSAVEGEVLVNIGYYEGALIIHNPYGTFFLAYESEQTFRIYIPEYLISCYLQEVLAFTDQFVYFQTSTNGGLSFTIPGVLPGAVFSKV